MEYVWHFVDMMGNEDRLFNLAGRAILLDLVFLLSNVCRLAANLASLHPFLAASIRARLSRPDKRLLAEV